MCPFHGEVHEIISWFFHCSSIHKTISSCWGLLLWSRIKESRKGSSSMLKSIVNVSGNLLKEQTPMLPLGFLLFGKEELSVDQQSGKPMLPPPFFLRASFWQELKAIIHSDLFHFARRVQNYLRSADRETPTQSEHLQNIWLELLKIYFFLSAPILIPHTQFHPQQYRLPIWHLFQWPCQSFYWRKFLK